MDTIRIVHTITEPTRARLLKLLSEHPYCVKALAKKLGISEPAVSQHMRVLKQCGIVTGIKLGYQMHYQVDRGRLLSLLGELSQQLAGSAAGRAPGGGIDCSCEFLSDCIKRDAKPLEESGHEK